MDLNVPLLFIDIRTHGSSTTFHLTEQGENILHSLSNKLIKVIGISGPQRTGKSFLANTLNDSMDGFAIGDSTLPQTKGIWMWGRPTEIDNQVCIILDTEGLNSIFRNSKIDSQILGITLLLSSVFIYNNFGVIDEKLLTNLCSVIEITKWVKEGNEIPYFLWCLRDFMLDYNQYSSSDDYMEQIVSPHQFDAASAKAKVRKTFCDFFDHRGCLFFVRPVNDEEKLRNIEKLELKELRPQFVSSLEEFKKRVFKFLKPKRYGNQILTGKAFVHLIKDILENFNKKQVPQLQNTIEIIIDQERKDIVREFEKTIKKFAESSKNKRDRFMSCVVFVWDKLVAELNQRDNLKLLGQIFSELLPVIQREIKNKDQTFLKENQYTKAITAILNDKQLSIKEQYKGISNAFKANNDLGLKMRVKFWLQVLQSSLKRADNKLINLEKNLNDELAEKQKDLQAEIQSKQTLNKFLNESRQTIKVYQQQLTDYQNKLLQKGKEIKVLLKNTNNKDYLSNQLQIYQEKIEKLEREKFSGRRDSGVHFGELDASVLNQEIVDLKGKDAQEIKNYFQTVTKQVVEENVKLSERIGQLMEENKQIKINSLNDDDQVRKI